MELLSTSEAAERLEITDARVRQMILDGMLPALRIGNRYAVRAEDLKLVKDRPKVGRPKKAEKGKEKK